MAGLQNKQEKEARKEVRRKHAGGREGDRQTVLTPAGSLPEKLQWLWLGQAEAGSLDLHLGLLYGCCCFPRDVSKELHQKWSSQDEPEPMYDARISGGSFYPLCHSTGSTEFQHHRMLGTSNWRRG